MRAVVSRLVDRWIDRGEGLSADLDPFAQPLPADEAAALRARLTDARFDERAPPFRALISVDGTSDRIDAVMRPPSRGAAWCLLAPPYGSFSRPGRLGIYELHARMLAAQGLGVAVLEPPFHGARTMRGQTSGWGFVRADLGHTMRAVLAYSAEVAALARHLREVQGAERVVGYAISLGGCALGLAAAHHAPFDKLAFLAAADGPASFYATGENREARRRTLASAGYDAARVKDAFRPVAPSTYAPPTAPALFAIPREDQVVPAHTQEDWRRAWQGEMLDMRWEGHGVALASGTAAREIARWLADPSTT